MRTSPRVFALFLLAATACEPDPAPIEIDPCQTDQAPAMVGGTWQISGHGDRSNCLDDRFNTGQLQLRIDSLVVGQYGTTLRLDDYPAVAGAQLILQDGEVRGRCVAFRLREDGPAGTLAFHFDGTITSGGNIEGTFDGYGPEQCENNGTFRADVTCCAGTGPTQPSTDTVDTQDDTATPAPDMAETAVPPTDSATPDTGTPAPDASGETTAADNAAPPTDTSLPPADVAFDTADTFLPGADGVPSDVDAAVTDADAQAPPTDLSAGTPVPGSPETPKGFGCQAMGSGGADWLSGAGWLGLLVWLAGVSQARRRQRRFCTGTNSSQP